MLKLAEFAPAATVTLLGTPAFVGLLLESVTTVPPAGAVPVSSTVPVVVEPPTSVEGFSANDDNAATCGCTAIAVVFVTPE